MIIVDFETRMPGVMMGSRAESSTASRSYLPSLEGLEGPHTGPRPIETGNLETRSLSQL